jgi:hypothetical protein
MENGPFIDGLPIENGDFPWLCWITRGYHCFFLIARFIITDVMLINVFSETDIKKKSPQLYRSNVLVYVHPANCSKKIPSIDQQFHSSLGCPPCINTWGLNSPHPSGEVGFFVWSYPQCAHYIQLFIGIWL